MSSYNKTENLGLNQWRESDMPKRTDFNYDNEVLDNVIGTHNSDENIHIVAEERDRWNSFMYTGMYFGNGTLERKIDTDCPFDVAFGLVFADELPTSIHYSDDNSTHHYLSFISQFGNSFGAYLDDDRRSINVNNSLSADVRKEYSNMNQNGILYRYVLFRDNRPE